MSEVIVNHRKGEYALVICSHSLKEVIPGQYVAVGENYYAISDFTAGSVSLLVKTNSRLDLPAGSQLQVSGPLGQGFPDIETPVATIAVAGTATGAGVLLAESRRLKGLKTNLIVVSRGLTPLDSRLYDLSWGDGFTRVFSWCTLLQKSRPSPPLSTFLSPKELLQGSLFLAGPKGFVNDCKENAKQMGLSENNIKTNY